MVALATDYVQFENETGQLLLRATCDDLRIDWPPPSTLVYVTPAAAAVPAHAWVGPAEVLQSTIWPVAVTIEFFARESYSQIPDIDAIDMSHVARGALFKPAGTRNKEKE